MPGEAQAAQTPPNDPRVDALRGTLDGLTTNAQTLERTIWQRLQDSLAKANTAAKELEAATLGKIGATNNRLEVAAGKMTGKLKKNLLAKIANAYNSAYSLGASYPLQQDVIAGLETGDYVGTMKNPSYMPNPAVMPVKPNPPPLPSPFQALTVPTEQLVQTTTTQDSTSDGNGSVIGGGGSSGGWGGLTGSNGLPCFDPADNLWWNAIQPAVDWTTQNGGTLPSRVVPSRTPGLFPPGCPSMRWGFQWCPSNFGGPCQYSFYLPLGYAPEMRPNAVVGVQGGVPDPRFYTCGQTVCPVQDDTGGNGGQQCPPPDCPPPTECPTPEGTDICKPPATAQCGFMATVPRMGLGDEVTCESLQSAVDGGDFTQWDLSKIIGAMTKRAGEGGIAQMIVDALTGGQGPIAGQLTNSFSAWLSDLNQQLAKATGCNVASLPAIATTAGSLNFIQQWFAIVPAPMQEKVRQILNTACQAFMPTGSQADNAYLSDTITEGVWECWHKAAGNLVPEVKKVMQAQRTRPNASELSVLCRRGQLSQAEYDAAVRQSGVISDEDKKRIFDLTQSWPGLGDLIRMMVRDVFDEAVVKDGQLDTDFDAKWTGDAEKFGKALGITKDTAKYYWRAHWQVPSFTMLAEMVKRLRPGVVDANLVFTQDDLKKWLKVDDWAPGLIDRMVATTFNVVTRIDARRMYALHTIDKDGLKGYLQDEGYIEDDASNLADFFEVQRRVAEFKASGQPTIGAMMLMFAKGEMTEMECRNYIANVALSEDHEKQLLDSLYKRRTIYIRQQGIKSVKAEFMRGLLDVSDANAALVDKGLDADQADQLTLQWQDELDAKSKIPSAAELCKWRGMGLIDPGEQGKALHRLGYRNGDISRIVGECEIEWTEKQRKAAERAAAKAQAEIEKLQKAQAAAAKAAAKAAADAAPCKPAPKPVCGTSPKTPAGTTPSTAGTNGQPATSP